jgi:hypothetical protein
MGWREPKRPTMLVIGEIDPRRRWSWHLAGDLPLDVEIRLEPAGAAGTLVTIAVDGSRLAAPKKLAHTALDRLHALCQTAASL